MANYSHKIFQDAIDHCRWKKVLHNVLKDINISNYENKTFEEIIINIYNICESVNGLGILTIYDISSSICRFYEINIDKVYIIGDGPKRTAKLLNIKTKKHRINDKININYVDIPDVIIAFNSKGYELEAKYRNTTNGDELETYMCNWQKKKL
jgi:hypothetical protein